MFGRNQLLAAGAAAVIASVLVGLYNGAGDWRTAIRTTLPQIVVAVAVFGLALATVKRA